MKKLSFTFPPPSRGDVLIQSGPVVVTWREVRGLRWVQWHWCPHHRVLLVRREPVPQDCFHSIPKGGTIQGLVHSNKLVLGLLYCCMSMTCLLWVQTCFALSLLSGVSYISFLCSQVLPTLLWNCLLWTLTTQKKLLRLLFPPHSARGNEEASIRLLNFVSGYCLQLSGKEIRKQTKFIISFLFFPCPQWALLGHCHLGDR